MSDTSDKIRMNQLDLKDHYRLWRICVSTACDSKGIDGVSEVEKNPHTDANKYEILWRIRRKQAALSLLHCLTRLCGLLGRPPVSFLRCCTNLTSGMTGSLHFLNDWANFHALWLNHEKFGDTYRSDGCCSWTDGRYEHGNATETLSGATDCIDPSSRTSCRNCCSEDS